MVSIGLSTLYLQIFSHSFQEVVELIKVPRDDSQDPDIWEIVDNGDHSLNKEKISLLSTLHSEGHRFTVHAPYDASLNIADPEAEKRMHALHSLKASANAAANIEARAWAFHPGFRRGRVDLKMVKVLNQDSLLTLYDYAIAAGVEPALENMTPGGPYIMIKPSDFEEFFEETGIRLSMVFDVAHAQLAGSLIEFISKLSSRFRVIHVHDNRGGLDEHLGVGEGVIDWEEVTSHLKNKGFNGIYIVEAVRRPFESMSLLRKLLS